MDLPVPSPVTPGAPASNNKIDIANLRQLLLAGEASSVARQLDEQLQPGSGSPAAWALLATAKRKLGEPEGAVRAWLEVASLGTPGERSRARYEAASLLQALSRHGEAVDQLTVLISEGAGILEPEARLGLARSLIASDRRPDAVEQLEELVRRFPGTSPAETASTLLREPTF